MKNGWTIAGKLVNIIGSLSGFAIVVVGIFQRDYKLMCFGVLASVYFKLDRISESIDKAVNSVDLLVKLAAECRSKGG